MTRALAVVLIGAFSLVASSCAVAEPSPAVTVTAGWETDRATVPSPPANPVPEVAWPLTGVDAADADAALLARPALSIKIENSVEARPQDGLDRADVVFEQYVESGISRLVAVFHSDVPDQVGPLRSVRPMDRNIMGSFGGPLVFSGAQPGFISEARNSGQLLIAEDTGGYGFFRLSGRFAPHNLWGTTEDFFAQSGDLSTPDLVWDFAYPPVSEPSAVAGEPASVLDIYISGWAQPEWTWDAASSSWLRTEKGVPMMTVDDVQVSATNILMLFPTIRWNSSGGGSDVPETVVVTDAGEGYLATGGSYVPITWSKAGQFDPYIVTTEDGEPALFGVGNTWVELIPGGGIATGSVTFVP